MNVVAEIHPRHTLTAVHAVTYTSHVVSLEFVKLTHVVRGGHDQPQQGTAFCCKSIFLELPMRHDFRHVLNVIHHGVVSREGLAQFVTENGGWGSLCLD